MANSRMTDIGLASNERSAEWRAHWPMVLTAFVGLSLSTVAIHSTGLVIAPLSEEFGWSRTQITAGITTATLLTIPLSPFVGALIDRFGVRRLALPGIVLASLGIAGISLANQSPLLWLVLWGYYGLAALFIKTTVWTAAITGAFTAARSMAISVILCGTAFSAILVPPLMQWLTDNLGWREAYLILSAAWGVPTLLLSYFFLFDAHDGWQKKGSATDPDAGQSPVVDLPGLSVREAVRSLALWRIAFATLIMLMISGGLIVHKVPLLTEMGVTRENAALLTSLTGVAAVVGKLVTGWMMERWDASLIGSLTNVAMGAALVFLLDPFRSTTSIVASMLVVGYAGGTKLQICVYLTGIYAGMRNYGKIFGVMASAIAVAGGVGPMLGGIIYDTFGGYGALIATSIPASFLCAGLILRLGEYPQWAAALAPKSKKQAATLPSA